MPNTIGPIYALTPIYAFGEVTSMNETMKQIAISILLLACSLSANVSAAAKSEHPNVVLIAIDDLNDWVGFLNGHPQVKTPNMDRLAQRGMVFANAHCAAPLCCPSRAAIFSGKQPFHTGVYGNDDNLLKTHPDMVMLTHRFADQGYRTLGTGKILHSGGKEIFQTYKGTEQRWSPFANARAVDYPAKKLSDRATKPNYIARIGDREIQLPLNGMPSERNLEKQSGESFDWGPIDVDDDQMGDARITTWAIEQLQQPSPQPFFLAVGYYRPHIPLFAPTKYFEQYPAESIELPEVLASDLDDLSETGRKWAIDPVTAGSHEIVMSHDQWKSAVAAYLACVSFVDAQIGRLLEELDNGPHAQNTIIVLFSDHGWHLGEKQHWGKWTGWERSTRVPLLVVPSQSDRDLYRTGTVCSQPVGLIDVYPTLLDLAGLPPASDVDGESLVASLKDPMRHTNPEVSTFDKGNYSIGDQRYRLVHYQDGNEELYDHETDPHEFHNLVDQPQFAEIRKTLASHLP